MKTILPEIERILGSDPVKHISTIGFFENYPVEAYYKHNSSLLVFGTSDHYWAHMVSDSANDVKALLRVHHNKTKYFYSVEDWMVPHLLKYGEVKWMMETCRFILPEDAKVAKPSTKIIKLDTSYSDYIFQHTDYKSFTSLAYVNERIQNDISAGILNNGKLVAWGLTHDDGALGFLHVLDEHRRKGYGSDIFLKLIEEKRLQKKPAFCNIVPDNHASIRLMRKIGFYYDRKVDWLKLK